MDLGMDQYFWILQVFGVFLVFCFTANRMVLMQTVVFFTAVVCFFIKYSFLVLRHTCTLTMAPAPVSQQSREDIKFSEPWRGKGTAPAHVSRDWVAPLRPGSRPTSSVMAGSRPPSSRLTPLDRAGFSRPSLSSEQSSPRELSWLPPLGMPLQGCRSSPSLRGNADSRQSQSNPKDGQTMHFEAFGHADLAAGQMMRLETLFRLYSQTKPFLVVGFLILYERGLVDLHDPISKFLPEFEAAVVGAKRLPLVRPISVHDLLAHTSGIGFGPGFGYDPENAYESSYVPLVRKVDLGEIQSLAEWCQELAKVPLRFQPGKDWGYGYSSDVLGRLIEVAAGQPLDQFLRNEILSPLNLSETFFQVPKNRAGALAALYKREPWHGSSKRVHFVTADVGGSGVLESTQQRVLAKPKIDPSSVLASENSVFLEGQAITKQVTQGGGCVCSVAGGLVSSLSDCGRFFTMLVNEGEVNGVRLLSQQSVQLLRRDWLNDFTREKRRQPLWVWNAPGIGFSPLGQLGVPVQKGAAANAVPRHMPGARLGAVHWGGAGGSGYMLDWEHRLVVLTYTGCVFDTSTQKAMWRAAYGTLRKQRPRGRWRSLESLHDAKTCSENSWGGSEAPSAKKSVISTGSSIGRPAAQLAVKKHVRNHAVYQRWQPRLCPWLCRVCGDAKDSRLINIISIFSPKDAALLHPALYAACTGVALCAGCATFWSSLFRRQLVVPQKCCLRKGEAELLEHQVERITGRSQVNRASKCEEDTQAPSDPKEACPSECPFAAELADPTKYCHFKNPYCRYCEVEACADCTTGRPGEESEAVETCKKCMPGYTLKDEGKDRWLNRNHLRECVTHGDWVFLALAAVAAVGALAWFFTLQSKPTVNAEGLQYGIYSQLRMMVTQDHHGDEGQPYPFDTNLLSVHVAGPGGTALFRFQAATILWALLVILGLQGARGRRTGRIGVWLGFVLFVSSDLLLLGNRPAATPRQLCEAPVGMVMSTHLVLNKGGDLRKFLLPFP
eukprot:s3119_g3.t1